MEEKIFLGGEQQQQRVLGDGGMVDARCEQHGQPHLGGGLHVNLVHADAVFDVPCVPST